MDELSPNTRSPRRKSPPPPPAPSHGRALSGSGILSKIPFMRSPTESRHRPSDLHDQSPPPSSSLAAVVAPTSAMSSVVQQQKTRRRRGSLRKVALLGRGAQRDRRDSSPLVVDTSRDIELSGAVAVATSSLAGERDALGLSVSDLTPRPSMDGFASRISLTSSETSSTGASSQPSQREHEREGQQQASYTSTTDEEDLLQIGTGQSRPGLSLSSGSESYFRNGPGLPGHRGGFQQAKSPLSYSGLATTPLPASDTDWDYTETEWWGWVVLTVTWFVFVIGMGSCLDVWSWAWDVGKTPYAPPELEDDPTLPIVGYYPALIILTCVMAWVWVVVAWVGMKYFRHAKISGD
ncbi:hypothetical protein NLU13_1676 [Sarocladium strictum]|uniref:Uncharacterized protein n=1 Tax=Sarocladium strictum TaxID=5046 RepID=A0AA39LCG0_SARSR|nr:hypothetical protein NLU13_1676 [Sarocladium strictum]